MVLARRGQLESELPGLSSLFTATNLPLLLLSVLFVKLLHELGHGLTCRHYGGECHELGVLIVGFMPLLYCDVSDSWLQQDRQKPHAGFCGRHWNRVMSGSHVCHPLVHQSPWIPTHIFAERDARHLIEYAAGKRESAAKI